LLYIATVFLYKADGHSDRVNDVVWYTETKALYSCSDDQHIVEWDVTTTKLRQ